MSVALRTDNYGAYFQFKDYEKHYAKNEFGVVTIDSMREAMDEARNDMVEYMILKVYPNAIFT